MKTCLKTILRQLEKVDIIYKKEHKIIKFKKKNPLTS